MKDWDPENRDTLQSGSIFEETIALTLHGTGYRSRAK